MERVLDQTAMTYPETYVREMTGEQLKFILESVCDNLFSPDPYYQQGGDMVRVGGLKFSCSPKASMGNRIGDLTLANGKPFSASASYKVAGWATVGSQSPGPDVSDVVADYLRDKQTITIDTPNEPVLKGVATNPGVADYKAKLL
jgi:sulfur-oxidizing protein SoxB